MANRQMRITRLLIILIALLPKNLTAEKLFDWEASTTANIGIPNHLLVNIASILS